MTRRKMLATGLSLCALACLAALEWTQTASKFYTRREAREPASAHQATRAEGAGQKASPRARIEGRVTGPAGPLANASVCATLADAIMWGDARVACAQSDDTGSYEISLGRGAYTLTASHEGYVPQTYREGQPLAFDASHDVTGLDFLLETGGALIQGSVEDASGGPIVDATVTLFQVVPSLLSLRVRTDSEGMFRATVQEGSVSVAAHAPGYAARTLEAVAPSEIEIALAPAGTIRGRVVAAADQEPVEGIVVKALAAGAVGVPVGPTGLSDAEGEFAISDVAPGTYILLASGSGHQGSSTRPVKVSLGKTVADALVVVSEGVHVRGRVRVHDGTPCLRGFVALGPPDPTLPRDALRDYAQEKVGPPQMSPIKADGEVDFPGVPEGFYHVTVMCIGHVLEQGPRVLRIGKVVQGEVQWTVSKGATLEVQVVDGAGQPVARAPFGVELPAGPGGERGRVMAMEADAQGRARIPGLQAGEYTLHPAKGQAGQPQRVRLLAGDRSTAELRLADSGSISVEVTRHDGKPAEGLQIEIRSTTTESAPRRVATALGNGQYRIAPLAEGAYRVTVSDGVNPPLGASDNQKTDLTLAAGASARLVLKLPAEAAITGRVLSARGEPLPNIWVGARVADPQDGPSSFAPHRASRRVLSDHEGKFELDKLHADGTFDVRADSPEGGSVLARGLAPGAQVELKLPAAARIRGVVVDERGQPVHQYVLRSFTADTLTDHEEHVVHTAGVFDLVAISPGQVELTAFAGQARGQAQIQVAPGQQVDGLRIVASNTSGPSAQAN